MAMIRAIVEGECNEEILASMAKGTLKNKINDLKRALKGFIQPHQQMILESMLSHISSLSGQIESLDEEIERRLGEKKGHIVEIADEIPGIGKQSAQVIVAEVGIDMSGFPSAKHLSSWAGLCPGNNESAGKKNEGNPVKATRR
jgi:transposase